MAPSVAVKATLAGEAIPEDPSYPPLTDLSANVGHAEVHPPCRTDARRDRRTLPTPHVGRIGLPADRLAQRVRAERPETGLQPKLRIDPNRRTGGLIGRRRCCHSCGGLAARTSSLELGHRTGLLHHAKRDATYRPAAPRLLSARVWRRRSGSPIGSGPGGPTRPYNPRHASDQLIWPLSIETAAPSAVRTTCRHPRAWPRTAPPQSQRWVPLHVIKHRPDATLLDLLLTFRSIVSA